MQSVPLTAALLAAPLFLAACLPEAGTTTAGPRPGPILAPREADAGPRGDLRTVMVEAHNRARAEFGVAPLRWDAGLAADATTYARELARTGRFAHSTDAQRRGGTQGENLWMGSRGAFNYRTMAGDWIEEKAWFRPGVFPNVSTTGNWGDVGHYTAIVWPATTAFGCGVASDARADYLVCRYTPQGNISGVAIAPR
ncbi:CAP domain-containing protein [Sphingomicrobium arenosum]|uniref:CAP domain-containing protein n=1 Tax=Sphingomicrobium arenosum TaxID=2233861 RepID=UPI00224046B0|nr:CAP domain-containing protein [Sphingomicrobium arenosum]